MEGYDQIFSVVNRIFRQDDAIQDQTLIRTAVFLVELLNIDLYHVEADIKLSGMAIYRSDTGLVINDSNACKSSTDNAIPR
jgi:hypothetical protein